LKFKGLPFEVTTEEIVSFFDGYKLVPDTIKIQRGDNDRPTGFGAAVFETEEEA
jgi:RNA recognition motif-containing protein